MNNYKLSDLESRIATLEAEVTTLKKQNDKSYTPRLMHALAALQHISRVTDDPSIAQFAWRAAQLEPSAFAPLEDYESLQ